MRWYWKLMVRCHNIAGPLITLAYPIYASVSAIESPIKEDDKQWLTYWVLFSLQQLAEIALDRVFAWVPFWYTIKLVAFGWLCLPQFYGAAYVYENYVKKYVVGTRVGRKEKLLTPRQRHVIEQTSPSDRACVSAFISEYGTDTFDKVVQAINEVNAKIKSPSSATRYRGSPSAVQSNRYTGSPTAAQPTRYTGSPTAAQPTRYTGSPTAVQPTRYTGSPSSPRTPPADQPTTYTRSPVGAQPTPYRGSPVVSPNGSSGDSPSGSPTSRTDKKYRKADTFREYYRQPVRILKSGFHSLEARRNDMRSKTNFNL